MENLEVHSKDFLIKWINVPDCSVVKWQVKPVKKSIVFRIYRSLASNGSSSVSAGTKKASSLDEKLANSSLQLIFDMGKLSPNELYQNDFTVEGGEGGVYAFVFDNTFSKSVSKKVLFNQFIEPYVVGSNESGSVSDPTTTSPIAFQKIQKSAPAHVISSASLPSDSRPVAAQDKAGLAPPDPNPRSRSVNRDRSSSVYTLSGLLNEHDEKTNNDDFQILQRLQNLQLANTSGLSPTTMQHPSINLSSSSISEKETDNVGNSSKFRKKPSHSSLSHHRANRNRSNSQTSIRTTKSSSTNNLTNSSNNSTVLDSSSSNLLKNNVVTSKNGQYIEGILLKKKRKKNSRSYSKRFFSLNFKHGVLEYRLNDQTSLTRGSMHIKLVEITANRKSREITIDSGVEIWHLKALNEVDWEIWVSALDIIRVRANYTTSTAPNVSKNQPDLVETEIKGPYNLITSLENVYHKVETTKQIAFNLWNEIKESNGSFIQYNNSNGLSSPLLTAFAPPVYNSRQLSHKSSQDSGLSLNSTNSDKSLRKRKSIFRRHNTSGSGESGSNSPTLPSNHSNLSFQEETINGISGKSLSKKLLNSATEACKVYESLSQISELLNNVISVEIQSTKEDKKIQRRMSASSLLSDNFFDAHEYIESIKSNDGVIIVDDDNFDDVKEDDGAAFRMGNEKKYQKHVIGQLINNKRKSLLKGSSLLDVAPEEGDEATITSAPGVLKNDPLYPLSLLNGKKIQRRNDIKDSTCTPPSLLQFFRKNVGKDLSSIAMPVTSNEPLTILQKFAEIFEYTDLIDSAIQLKNIDGERILYISAFAISYLSSFRSKERNIRKPFMPLLGETYELVRDDLQYRLVLEKVSHKPPIFCLNVESKEWEINSTIMPVNKFWGKSLEIINKGSFKLLIKKTNEIYEWNQPTTLLKNLIAGEKYIEPTDSITVNCSNGEKSVVEFKAGGMFSGRSEEVAIKAYDSEDKLRSHSIHGTWTQKLSLSTKKSSHSSAGTVIWTAHPLLPNAQKKWGFTKFAAELNEITSLESRQLPPTDSRLRPDMKHYEDGDVDTAETLKLELEQKQRDRRKQMELAQQKHCPVFFQKTGDASSITGDSGDDILLNWTFVKGEKSYWNRRKQQDWDDLLPLYDNNQ